MVLDDQGTPREYAVTLNGKIVYGPIAVSRPAKRVLGSVICPECGTDYSVYYYTYPVFRELAHYCPNCGQAIDWSDYSDSQRQSD